jgi:DNA-binding IclR family transcriptional regulator
MSGRSREAGRSVLSKAFAILDAMRAAEVSLTRAQIARRTGLPMTTVYRLARELRRHGALELTDRGRYRVGPWLWEVGTLTPHTLTLREAALPFMEDLYESTHENITLAVLDGYEALVIERIYGRRSSSIPTRVGGRLPLHATGVGKALLAASAPEFVEAVIARQLPPITPYTITDPDSLRHDLALARRNGYAVVHDEMRLNRGSVAAAVWGPGDKLAGAISIVIESQRADVNRLALALRTAAFGLSRRLGQRRDAIAIVAPAPRPVGSRTAADARSELARPT